ncbi:hypothetical protein [Kosmotoga pacifica]|uniref:Uncharacterized protein n=1 Tax=Kosmotoga pacifica TaxID=1330330 RepID=A0A0G2ZCY5_9BACT|nr:hypothetical protein [Kosmotoga pacifica]AKI96643.1 hypothetical protein IX53_01075 [Kosmotoga pacifica]
MKLRKSFVFLLFVILATTFLISSCSSVGGELKPDKNNSVIRFIVKNPRYESDFSHLTIPVDTESFGIVAKEYGSDTCIKYLKAFGTEEYLIIEMKIPGDKMYSFYFMGIDKNNSLTCINLSKNIYLPSGEATSFTINMLPIEKSVSISSESLSSVLFKEPQYSYEDPRYVDWIRAYYYFTFTATDLGIFYEDLYNEDRYYTKYSFDIWNSKEFYLNKSFYWYTNESFYDNSYYYDYYIEKVDSNTIKARVPVYFPISYHDDGTQYPYTDGTLSFYSPNELGGLNAGFGNIVSFSELSAKITVIIE